MRSSSASPLLQPWILAARPKTLAAGIIPVAVGTVLGAHIGSINWLVAASCLLGALLIQIGCNFANDAFDALSGADTADRVGPMRAVSSGAISTTAMFVATAIILLLAFGVGLYLASIGGWVIFALGIISIICAVAYTGGPIPLAYIGLGDVFVFLFFGLFATIGSAYLQLCAQLQLLPRWHSLGLDLLPASWWWIAVCLGCQATAILVVNNVRDRVGDARCGKRTLIVRFGHRFGITWFAVLHVVASGALVAAALLHQPQQTWLLAAAGLALIGGAWCTWRLATRSGAQLNRLLAQSSALEALTGVAVMFAVSIGP